MLVPTVVTPTNPFDETDEYDAFAIGSKGSGNV